MRLERYRITGLTCADCAGRIERAAAALPGVRNATLNVASGTLLLEHSDRPDATAGERDHARTLARIIREIEPAAALANRDDRDASEQDGRVRRRKIRLLLAILLFGSGLFVPDPLGMPLMVLAYLVAGAEVIWRAVRGVAARRPLDESVLMTIATAGAWMLAEAGEAAAVMVFYQLGDTLQAMAVNRSRKSVAALLDLRPRTVRVLLQEDGAGPSVEREDRETLVDPAVIVPGDLIVTLPGERIPVDGVVVRGSGSLDTSAITGESLPAPVDESMEVKAGVVSIDSRLVIRALATEGESTVARMLALVEDAAARKAPTEQLMSRLARIYTPLVVGGAVLLALVPPLLGFGSFGVWAYRALVFLVVSCPCALVVSIPLGYFAGIGAASRRGILIKGGQYLDALARVTTVVFDKTGTITTGHFRVAEARPVPDSTPDLDRELLRAAYRAACRSSHPVSRAVAAWGAGQLSPAEAEAIVRDSARDSIREIAGRGVIVGGTTETTVAGSAIHLLEQGIPVPDQEEGEHPGTAMHVALDGRYLGSILVQDQIRPGTASVVEALRRQGVERVVLLSGDHGSVVQAAGREIGADLALGDLLPRDKVREIEALISPATGGGRTMFVGDGINDAAVIARADVGVAMGGIGSDAAVEAADVVLMRDDPGLIPIAIGGARQTQRIVMQNVVFALGTKVIFLLAASFGFATMWMAVFADVGVTVLTVLNTLRVLAIALPSNR